MTDLMARVARPVTDPVAPLTPALLQRVKCAYTTRFVGRLLTGVEGLGYGLRRSAPPRSGDVVLATVEVIGRHKRLESPESRRAALFPGDHILVAYGHRYAPDQFEAEIPADLEETHLVAAGGVAGTVTAAYAGLEPPTVIRPVGLVSSQRGVLNLADAAPLRVSAAQEPPADRPPVVAVVGTSMNSGKSTVLASLTNGLSAAGLCVAAGKVTGTGAGGDVSLFRDAGARRAIDFTDFGLASTYRLERGAVGDLMSSMVAELAEGSPDVILIEVADGICQLETSELLADPSFTDLVDRVVFAAGDALGAQAGVEMLSALGLAVSAVSGRLTSSPLATREAMALLPVDVLGTESLCYPDVASAVLHGG